MKGKKKKDEKDGAEENITRRKFLSGGKTVLLGASYVAISVLADRGDAFAQCTGCTSGSTTVTVPRCTSCTACTTGCTSCTKVCISGCCISCTKCTSQ